MPSSTEIQAAQTFIDEIFGYRINNCAYISEAIDTSGLSGRQSNKRMALVGDGALDMAVKSAWYCTGKPTGVCSAYLLKLSNANLAIVARDIGLGRHVIVNPGHLGDVTAATLATSLEAVVGAIYLDCGENILTIQDVMHHIGMDVPGRDTK